MPLLSLSALPRPRLAPAGAAVFLSALAFFLGSCKPPGPGADVGAAPETIPLDAGDQLRLSVSIPPQADFVRRIGGDRVTVTAFVAAGQDPHHFSATPKQVIDLAESDAFFSIGMPFEAGLLPKVRSTLPGLKIFDMAAGIDFEKETAELHGAHDHDHAHATPDHDAEIPEAPADSEAAHSGHDGHGHDGHGHDHEHGADPHLWLSPPLILDMARNIHDALVTLDPSGASTYAENLRAFQEEVDLLHTDLLFILEPCRGMSFYVYHPAFHHFARAYGLTERSIEVGGKNPSPKQLMQLIDDAKRDGAKVIFVQPQFDPASAETVAKSIGGRVTSIDPLAEDVLANLRVIARTIHDGLATE